MIVIADTGPLNYLFQIECDHLLAKLYQRVIVPEGVMRELSHDAAPFTVRKWLAQIPEWVKVMRILGFPDSDLTNLDLGEREAIQLAEEQHADMLLMDERKGRRKARARGLRTTGTLGVLLAAGELRLIDPEAAFRQLLSETSFRATSALEEQFLGLIRP